MRVVKFGADGIRGVAGKWPLTRQAARSLGCALGRFLRSESGGLTDPPHVIIGRDTRPSGVRLVRGLIAGLRSQGVDVTDLGIVTTPGVAYLTKRKSASLGLIVSASHNPPEYNGIKFVDSRGLRLRREAEIEDMINESAAEELEPSANEGQRFSGQHLVELYIQDQVRLCPFKSLHGLKLVLDCANGAASQTAPLVFKELHAEVWVMNESAEHKINDRCGSEYVRQHPQDLIEAVRRYGAAYGFAFDGDGDRLVVVDKDGYMYDGDDFLFVLARYFHELGELRGETIVTTHMANTGLKKALISWGISTVLTEHGDKHLEAEIWSKNYLLGSEQVGNVIIHDGHHAAADSLYAAMIISGIICTQGALCDLVSPLQKYPQVLASTHVARMPPLEKIGPLQRQREGMQAVLGENSRMLAWYSGTEGRLFKTMVEGSPGNTLEQVQSEAVAVCRIVQHATGSEDQEPTVLDLSSRNRVRPAKTG